MSKNENERDRMHKDYTPQIWMYTIKAGSLETAKAVKNDILTRPDDIMYDEIDIWTDTNDYQSFDVHSVFIKIRCKPNKGKYILDLFKARYGERFVEMIHNPLKDWMW